MVIFWESGYEQFYFNAGYIEPRKSFYVKILS